MPLGRTLARIARIDNEQQKETHHELQNRKCAPRTISQACAPPLGGGSGVSVGGGGAASSSDGWLSAATGSVASSARFSSSSAPGLMVLVGEWVAESWAGDLAWLCSTTPDIVSVSRCRKSLAMKNNTTGLRKQWEKSMGRIDFGLRIDGFGSGRGSFAPSTELF